MARKQRNNVDYFPHPVTHGKKMSYLEKKYQNDGYAVWFKILEELGSAEYHYLNLSDDVQIMFLSDRCLVSEERLINIINDLVKLREFDKDLWENNRIIFNEKFIESVADAYKKRNNNCINKNALLQLLASLGIRKPPKSNRKPQKSNSEVSENPQRIVKDSIEKETKGKERIETALDLISTEKQIRYQEFLMQHKKQVDDWDLCVKNFNSKMDLETAQNKIDFNADQLFSRFEMWVRSWIKNQDNSHKHQKQQEGKGSYNVPIG